MPPRSKAKKLTAKHRMFVAKYTQVGSETYHNGTKSAIAAGYSPRTATVQASLLLTNANISSEIISRANKQFEDIDISAKRVLRALGNLAFYDPRKFWNDDGSLKAVTELDLDTAQALAGFEIEKLYKHFAKGQAEEVGKTSKIKLVDRVKPLELLSRHHKLLTDKIEVGGDERIVQALMEGRKRLRGEHLGKKPA